jgi:hypothetical protein
VASVEAEEVWSEVSLASALALGLAEAEVAAVTEEEAAEAAVLLEQLRNQPEVVPLRPSLVQVVYQFNLVRPLLCCLQN